MRWIAFAFVVLTLDACAPADPCGGPPPDIETCQVGVPFADCGGTDAPRYACGPPYGCRWFSHGCVAAGWVARDCPPRDAYGFAQAWGADPWDATRERNVDVVLGPPSTDARPTLTCTGHAFSFPCPLVGSGLLMQRHADARSATFVLGYMHSIGGLDVSLEILTEDDGSAHGRVCTVPYDDGPGIEACATGRGRGVCATAGTITIDAVPRTEDAVGAAHFDASATFADGSTLELRL
jgi:hypothetical protein